MGAADGTAMVRVLHASPDAPEVDVYLDGVAVGDPLAGLSFGSLSQYVEVPAGPHAIKVCATADPAVCPIDVPEVSVEDGQQYTVAATNVLDSIEAQVLVDTGTRRWTRPSCASSTSPRTHRPSMCSRRTGQPRSCRTWPTRPRATTCRSMRARMTSRSARPPTRRCAHRPSGRRGRRGSDVQRLRHRLARGWQPHRARRGGHRRDGGVIDRPFQRALTRHASLRTGRPPGPSRHTHGVPICPSTD